MEASDSLIPPGAARPRSPLAELLTLAAPTVAQMASYTVMQFIDTWMLSRVGADAATAAGNSGMFAFSVIGFGFGVLWVVNTLVSQSFGAGNLAACGRYLWQGVWFGLGISLLALPSLPFAGPFFRFLGHEPALAGQEGMYFRIVMGAMILKLVGAAFGQFMLATNRPGRVLAASVAGVAINAGAAWMMVFGHGGFHPMGVAGAAWGQNVGVAAETALLLLFAWQEPGRSRFNVPDIRPRLREMKTLVTVGVPSGVQLVADVLAWSVFTVWVMGQFGTRAMAANTFMFRYMVVSFMPAFGLSAAVTALVGRYIGSGQPDVATARAHLGFKVTAAYMLSCGLIFLFGRNVLIGIFTHDPEVLRMGSMLLVFAAVYQFFDAVYIIYSGALRGAGDTFVPAVATGTLCWGITVFGGYTTARLFPQFGPIGPWTAATLYGVVLGVFIYLRFQRGGWRSIRLDRQPSSDTVSGFEPLEPARA